MKKSIILISLIILSTVMMAQKGSWYLGGLAGYGSSTGKDANDTKTITSNWAFGPEFGTFLSNSIQLGFITGLSGGTSKVGDEKDYSTSSFSPTVYGRKFIKITETFSGFGGLYLSYISGSRTNFDYTSGSEVEMKYKQSGFGASIGVGVAFALSPRFTAVGQYGLLGYTSTTSKDNDGNKTSTDSSLDFGVNTVGGSTLSQGNGSGAVFNIGIYYTIVQPK